MQINLTKYERAELDKAIYRIFPEIEDYEAGILDRVVEDLMLLRFLAVEDLRENTIQTMVKERDELEAKVKVLEHNVRAVHNFMAARQMPDILCVSGRCDDTNWGGKDRLHSRGPKCPEYDDREITEYLRRAGAI
jgi:hypothetical protein